MNPLNDLTEIFRRFPGIGPRQAKRFVYYLLGRSSGNIREFIRLIEEVRKQSAECPSCHRIFLAASRPVSPISHLQSPISTLCPICSDSSRDQSSLMIVSRDSDFESIEKSGAYRGLYFILGGSVPILDKEPEKRIRLESLLGRVSKPSSKNDNQNNLIKEIILSLNTTPEGEHTAQIVKEALNRIIKDGSIKISILGRGLSTGAELEYADRETIKSALENRN